MKRFSLLIFISFSLLCACSNQPVKKASGNNSLLWQINGNGIEKPSYLFGTMHIIPKNDFFLVEGTTEAFDATDVLVMEIDIDIPFKEQLALASKMIIPNGKNLSHYMPEEDFTKLKSYLIDSIGVSEKRFNKYIQFKPFFLGGLLIKEYVGKVKSYEEYFEALRKKSNKQFMALETLDFQLSLIDTISIEKQAEGFTQDELFSEFDKLLTLYANQDIEGLGKLMSDTEGFEELEYEFIVKRNTLWVEKLDKLFPTQSMFIAVGAGHLPGENGVIALLRKIGYSVEPVN